MSAREFIEENLVIRTKDARIVPLRLNPAQERLYAALETQRAAGRPMRVIILKARQLGYSTLGEMLTFQYNDSRRPEAMPGEHDDLVMALAIAHGVRGQQDCMERPDPARQTVWTRDMLEDWLHADEEGSRMLVRMWGQPTPC